MKDYSVIFSQGFVFGNLNEFTINYDEFLTMCEKVRDKAIPENKEKNFDYTNRPALRNYILKKEYNEDIYQYFRDITLQIMSEIAPEYNYIPTTNGHFGDLISLMEKSGFSGPHRDGNVGELTMLIYLSDVSCYNGSGKLSFLEKTGRKRMNIETSDPIEGNYTIMETNIHNLPHRVEVVDGDFKRLVYVGRIKRKE